VVTLDLGRVLRAGLDDIGIQGPLDEEASVVQLVAGNLFEDPDEGLADDLALGLGVRNAGQLLEEAIGRFDVDQIHLQVAPEGVLYLLRLTLPQKPVVDEDAGQLISHRSVHQGGGDRRVHTPRQCTHHPFLADERSDRLESALDDGGHRPGREQVAAFVEEVLQQLGALWCVDHLWVELDTEQTTLRVFERGHGTGRGRRGHPKTLGRTHHGVVVAHPHALLRRQLGEQGRTGGLDVEIALAELRDPRAGDFTAERLCHQLQPVADPEDRNAELEQLRLRRRSPR
jgi:hypothetical protein